MPTINECLEFNKQFVADRRYEQYAAKPSQERKLAIVTCMDTRLVELLPAALGIENGQAKIIKNAGAIIVNSYGSVMRSLLLSVYALGVREIMIIGHTDCGVKGLDVDKLLNVMRDRGVTEDAINQCPDVNQFFHAFTDDDESIRHSMQIVRDHPMMPNDIPIRGFMMDVKDGHLREVN